MDHRVLKAREQAPGFRCDMCQRGLSSGKCPNSLHRLKQGDGHNFDLFPSISEQDIGSGKAVDALKPRENLRAKEFLVGLCMLSRCTASPESSNHGNLLSSTPRASTARAV